MVSERGMAWAPTLGRMAGWLRAAGAAVVAAVLTISAGCVRTDHGTAHEISQYAAETGAPR